MIDSTVRLALASPRKRAKLRAILGVLPPVRDGARCVDLGTGTGAMAHCFAGAGAWTFVDLSTANLETAGRFVRGSFVAGDADQFLLRSAAGGLDLITCFDTLMYLPDPPGTVAAMARALAPGGELVVSGTEHQRRGDLLIWLRRRLGLENALEFRYHLSAVDMQRLVSQAGLEALEIRRFSGFFTTLLQSAIDLALVLGRRDHRLNDAHALDLAAARGGGALLTLLSVFSAVAGLLDRVCFFLPRYGYVLRSRRRAEGG